MIRLKIYQGLANKLASPITDDMIHDLPSAYIRGQQEMTSHRAIFRSRALDLPYDPNLDIGALREVVVGHMGIYGNNEVTAISFSIDNGGIITQAIETRQIGGVTP